MQATNYLVISRTHYVSVTRKLIDKTFRDCPDVKTPNCISHRNLTGRYSSLPPSLPIPLRWRLRELKIHFQNRCFPMEKSCHAPHCFYHVPTSQHDKMNPPPTT